MSERNDSVVRKCAESHDKPHIWLEDGKWHCVSGTPFQPIRAKGRTVTNAYRTWRLIKALQRLDNTQENT